MALNFASHLGRPKCKKSGELLGNLTRVIKVFSKSTDKRFMILITNKTLNNEEAAKVNAVALDVAMTISSLAPRSVPTNIVGNNMAKVQSIGSEIGVNNLPTSAGQLKHKVIKVCEVCGIIELTNKYNFKASYEKCDSHVLCRICSQNTDEEYQRRSQLQLYQAQEPRRNP